MTEGSISSIWVWITLGLLFGAAKSVKGLLLARFKAHHRIPFLDRLYDDRDQARAERDRYQAGLTAQRDRHQAELSAERDRYKAELSDRRPRPADSELTHGEVPPTPFGRTEALADIDDRDLVSRIVAAYQASIASSLKPSQSMWELIAEKRKARFTKLWLKVKLKKCNASSVTQGRPTYSTGSRTLLAA
jgi:hypothetical protein